MMLAKLVYKIYYNDTCEHITRSRIGSFIQFTNIVSWHFSLVLYFTSGNVSSQLGQSFTANKH